MAPLTQWTWVCVNSRSWWWTGRPGVLQFMGSERVRHNWATEPNWTELNYFTILWWLCHTSTWIDHRYTCASKDESHLGVRHKHNETHFEKVIILLLPLILGFEVEVVDMKFWLNQKFYFCSGVQLLIWIAVILVFGRKVIVRPELAAFKFLFYYSIFLLSHLRGWKKVKMFQKYFPLSFG